MKKGGGAGGWYNDTPTHPKISEDGSGGAWTPFPRFCYVHVCHVQSNQILIVITHFFD